MKTKLRLRVAARPVRPIKITFYVLAVFSTILIGIGAFKFFGPAHHPPLQGELLLTEIPGQNFKLNAYFDSKMPGHSCKNKFIARDEVNLFVELDCEGNLSYHKVFFDPATTEITGNTATQDGSFYQKSLIRLFPKVVFDKLKLENTLAR